MFSKTRWVNSGTWDLRPFGSVGGASSDPNTRLQQVLGEAKHLKSVFLERQGEYELEYREERLRTLELEGKVALRDAKARDDAKTILALECALDEAIADAKRNAVLAREKQQLLLEAESRTQTERGSGNTEQVNQLQRQLEQQAAELASARLQLQHQANKLEASSKRSSELQRCLEESCAAAEAQSKRMLQLEATASEKEAELVDSRKHVMVLEQRAQVEIQEHEAHIKEMQRKTADLILLSIGPFVNAASSNEEERYGVNHQAEVLELLAKMYSGEMDEEEAAQKLAIMKCELVASHVPEVEKQSVPPVTATGSMGHSGDFSFQTSFVMADQSKLMRLIGRAAQVRQQQQQPVQQQEQQQQQKRWLPGPSQSPSGKPTAPAMSHGYCWSSDKMAALEAKAASACHSSADLSAQQQQSSKQPMAALPSKSKSGRPSFSDSSRNDVVAALGGGGVPGTSHPGDTLAGITGSVISSLKDHTARAMHQASISDYGKDHAGNKAGARLGMDVISFKDQISDESFTSSALVHAPRPNLGL